MDTRWFAVDADGYVGVFETGEDGALPMSAAAGPEAGTLDLWPLEATSAAAAIAAGQLPTDGEDFWGDSPQRVLVVLTPQATAQRRDILTLLGEGASIVRDDAPCVLASGRLTPKAIASLRNDPRFAAVLSQDTVQEWFRESDGSLYPFRNGHEPGLYMRIRTPGAPILASALPEPFAAEISRAVLPIRFAQSEQLHLADHLRDIDCHIYGDRTLRNEPLPGIRFGLTPQRPPTWLVLALLVLAVLLLVYFAAM